MNFSNLGTGIVGFSGTFSFILSQLANCEEQQTSSSVAMNALLIFALALVRRLLPSDWSLVLRQQRYRRILPISSELLALP